MSVNDIESSPKAQLENKVGDALPDGWGAIVINDDLDFVSFLPTEGVDAATEITLDSVVGLISLAMYALSNEKIRSMIWQDMTVNVWRNE